MLLNLIEKNIIRKENKIYGKEQILKLDFIMIGLKLILVGDQKVGENWKIS